MKIFSIVGARPQFVKAAVVSRAIAAYNASDSKGRPELTEVIVHTGQHYDRNLSEVFFKQLQLSPDYDLGIKESTHGRMTAAMLMRLEELMLRDKPDAVVIYGDTNSTLAAALAASKLGIPITHVEAGLRSYNMRMPEEINRIVSDKLSTWLFCPTQTAVANLHNEGIGLNPNSQSDNKFYQHVLNVGDVMYDAFLLSKKWARADTELPMAIQELTDGFYLATVHRSENTDNPIRLKSIMNALGMIAVKKPVVLPIHPRTRKAITALRIKKNDIKLIDPVGYFDMLRMLDACDAVFTDSGGLQKEACFAEKLCVTLRDETEWTELVKNGFNILAGTTQEKITCAEKKLSTIQVDWNVGLYGDGNAGEKIIEAIAGQ